MLLDIYYIMIISKITMDKKVLEKAKERRIKFYEESVTVL